MSQNSLEAKCLNELKMWGDEEVEGRFTERLGVTSDSGNLLNYLLLEWCIRKLHSSFNADTDTFFSTCYRLLLETALFWLYLWFDKQGHSHIFSWNSWGCWNLGQEWWFVFCLQTDLLLLTQFCFFSQKQAPSDIFAFHVKNACIKSWVQYNELDDKGHVVRLDIRKLCVTFSMPFCTRTYPYTWLCWTTN